MEYNKQFNNWMKIAIIILCIALISIPAGVTYYEVETDDVHTETDVNASIDSELDNYESKWTRNTRSGDSENWSGSWAPKTPMPTARKNFAIGVVNGKIYAIGGWAGTEALNVTEEYNPITDTWTTKRPMLTARQNLAIAVVNNKIYAIGGSIYDPGYGIGWRSLATVECYDPSTDSWNNRTEMPTPRMGLACDTVNGKIYAVGGHKYNSTDSGYDLNVTEEYDPLTNSWSSKTPMPTPRVGLAACVVNNKIYTIGGQLGEDWKNVTEEYNPETNTWTTKDSMPTARSWFAIGVINNKIYAIGGFKDYLFLNITEKYDLDTNEWTRKAPMPTNRLGFAMGVVNNISYAVGGRGRLVDEINVTEEYNPNPPHHVVITPLNVTITADQNQQFNANIYDEYNNILYLNVNWEVTNGTIDEKGLFYPYATGNWTIYANFSYDSTTISGNTTITAIPGVLYYITIIPNTWIMYLNDSKQFLAHGYDAHNNEVSISPIWSINCDCTITQDGLLIADTLCLGKYSLYANQSDISGIATVTVQVNSTADTDSDGMPDYWEVKYNLDPFNGSDANLDPDLDYLTNLQEFHNYSKPNINDTDVDSLGDGFEVIFSKTNASLWDTNGNGIGDGLEFIQSKGYLGWIESLPDDWIGMIISWANYTIFVKTNSSVLEGEFKREEQKLKIKVSGPEGTSGTTEIDVPKSLCEPEDIEIKLDGELINYTITEDDTYYYIHIEYNHSVHILSIKFYQKNDEDSSSNYINLLVVLISIFIIMIVLVSVIKTRKENGNIIETELPPEELLKLLEKEHADGEITDETYEDVKSFLEEYQE